MTLYFKASDAFATKKISPCRSCSPRRCWAFWGRKPPAPAAPHSPSPETWPADAQCSCSSSWAPCVCPQTDSTAGRTKLEPWGGRGTHKQGLMDDSYWTVTNKTFHSCTSQQLLLFDQEALVFLKGFLILLLQALVSRVFFTWIC